MSNFCEQYGLPPIAPSWQKGKHARKHDNQCKRHKYKRYPAKPSAFYDNKKHIYKKHDKQKFGKGKCFNCGKFGHFSKECKQKPGNLKNRLNMLNINDNDQEELFHILESINLTDSLEEDFSSSSDSGYHSSSETSTSPANMLNNMLKQDTIIKNTTTLSTTRKEWL